MSLETTVPFDGSQEDICVLGSAIGDSGQSLLLTYHDRFGHAQRPCVPSEPPTAISWNAQYEVIKQLGQGAGD